MNAHTTNVISNNLYAKWQTDGFSLVTNLVRFHVLPLQMCRCLNTPTACMIVATLFAKQRFQRSKVRGHASCLRSINIT